MLKSPQDAFPVNMKFPEGGFPGLGNREAVFQQLRNFLIGAGLSLGGFSDASFQQEAD